MRSRLSTLMVHREIIKDEVQLCRRGSVLIIAEAYLLRYPFTWPPACLMPSLHLWHSMARSLLIGQSLPARLSTDFNGHVAGCSSPRPMPLMWWSWVIWHGSLSLRRPLSEQPRCGAAWLAHPQAASQVRSSVMPCLALPPGLPGHCRPCWPWASVTPFMRGFSLGLVPLSVLPLSVGACGLRFGVVVPSSGVWP